MTPKKAAVDEHNEETASDHSSQDINNIQEIEVSVEQT